MQIYSFERYIGPTIVSERTQYNSVEIFVDFIESRPTFDLELVFKDDAGVKHKSDKFKKRALVLWNLDMSVHLSDYFHRPQILTDSIQLC